MLGFFRRSWKRIWWSTTPSSAPTPWLAPGWRPQKFWRRPRPGKGRNRLAGMGPGWVKNKVAMFEKLSSFGCILKPDLTYGSLLRLFGHSSRCSFFEPSNFTGMVQIGSKMYHLLGTTFDRGICLSHHPFHHSTIELAEWQTYDIDS